MPNLDVLPKQTVAPAPQTENPGEGKPAVSQRRYIPMNVPVQRLQVPEMPGYHYHWFRGDRARLMRAEQAGYEYVDEQEVELNNLDIGGESAASGNTDMGTRVTVISGEQLGNDGQPGRLVLMKIKTELWQASEKILADHNEQIAEAIRGGQVGTGPNETPADKAQRYVKQTEHLFTRRKVRS